MDGTFEEYLQLMIQFGFVTLFSAAFTLAPLIAILQNMTIVKVERYKMLDLFRRPLPLGAKNIGNWL